MSKIVVCNAANTSEFDKIGGKSCIKYWDEHTPNKTESIRFCRATYKYGTEEDPIIGGHVLAILGGKPRVFITPILKSYNTANDPKGFSVSTDDLVPVPAADEQAILNMKGNVDRLKNFMW